MSKRIKTSLGFVKIERINGIKCGWKRHAAKKSWINNLPSNKKHLHGN